MPLKQISILNVIPDVTYLDLSVNPIGKSLNDDSFKNIVSLESLYLVNCQIEILPPKIFAGLYRLKVVDLSENYLIYIDLTIFSHLTMIEMLFLDGNNLDELNFGILDISNNNMSGFDLEYVAVLKNLQILNIESCGLKKINKQIIQYQLEELKEIYIDGNFWDLL
ncbi:reticulon-4 receptor-like 1 [Culicoides brevitarsis]|uniref:reticulon-4 receptor-like 1 n=1 Tax=Culicoides brevitarsis TaxID=469753 RepID=UPI00307B7203